jgi:hypothetical protein
MFISVTVLKMHQFLITEIIYNSPVVYYNIGNNSVTRKVSIYP